MKLNETETLFADLARALVDDPDMLRINVLRGQSMTVIELEPAPGDISKLIGRGGRTADAVRLLLANVSAKERRRYELQIVEAGG